ncbi:MAG: SHD1 domain-containing protein [Pirellulales bacterium]
MPRTVSCLAFSTLLFVATLLSAAPLPSYKVGERVELFVRGDYLPGTVKKVDGRWVDVEFVGGDGTKDVRTYPVDGTWVRKLEKPAPEKAALPAVAAPPLKLPLRKWKDVTGKYETSARLVALEGDAVRLETADGKVLTLKLDQLSEHDRQMARDGGKKLAAIKAAETTTAVAAPSRLRNLPR